MTEVEFEDDVVAAGRERVFDPEAAALRLAAAPGRRDRLLHLEVQPPRSAEVSGWPDWAHPAVTRAFLERSIVAPWSHQAAAADLAWRGRHTVVATGTASGKSLSYLLPALSAIARGVDFPGVRADRGGPGGPSGPGDTVLYLSPTKALAQDQLDAVRSLQVPGVRAATYDGDSSREERDWVRAHGNYVLTNPDMLHRTLLPGHARWSLFWSSLRFVVVDECHHYRGVFGAHVAQILRRLRRIAAHYGADPTFVLASATTAQPEVTAALLVGLPVTALTRDGAPRGGTAASGPPALPQALRTHPRPRHRTKRTGAPWFKGRT